MAEIIIVSKHKSIEEYLKKNDIVPGYTKCYPFITPEFARGKHIYGIVPFAIAAEAAAFTEVKITLRREDAGKVMTAEEIAPCVRSIRTYTVLESVEDRII